MKRIITLQDISCAGRCSITVALPVLSCLKVETCVLPTALYSTHTAFKHFVSYDLSDHIGEISENFHKNGLDFDAIYTGYMASDEQIDAIISFIESNKGPKTLILVDPAMADNGALYAGLPEDFASSMKRLISKADVIIPNLTEAMMLTGRLPAVKGAGDNGTAYLTPEEIDDILHALSDEGPGTVMITGVRMPDDLIGVYCYDKAKDTTFCIKDKAHFGDFPGTGDLFASVVCGCLVQGLDIKKAAGNAVHFVSSCIEASLSDPDRRPYGLSFEKCLGLLPEMIS